MAGHGGRCWRTWDLGLECSRQIRLRAQRRIPDTLDGEQIAAIVAACDRLRNRFLFLLLAESGLRIGEALGLRHSDIDPAARHPRVVTCQAAAAGGGVPGLVFVVDGVVA